MAGKNASSATTDGGVPRGKRTKTRTGTEVGHPLFRLATNPPGHTSAEGVLQWLANEDPIVPAIGDPVQFADLEALGREAEDATLDLDREVRDDFTHRAGATRELSDPELGWIAASFLARRALPIWLEVLGKIGPAHTLIATPPVRGKDSSLLGTMQAVQRTKAQLEASLARVLGEPAWSGPREPVIALIDYEAGEALKLSGADSCAALSEDAGTKARDLSNLANEVSRRAMRVAGHFVTERMLQKRGSLDKSVFAEIQRTVRDEFLLPAERLESVTLQLFTPRAKARAERLANRSGR